MISQSATCERVEGVEYPRDLHDCISVQTWTFSGPKFIIRGVPFQMIHAISWRPLTLALYVQPSKCRLIHRGDEIIREESGYVNYMRFSHPLPIFCLTHDELQLVFLDAENSPIKDDVEMEVSIYGSNFADEGTAREMTRVAFYWTALGYFNPHTLLKISHWMIVRPYEFSPEVQYYGIDETCEGKKCDCESLSSYSVFKKDIEEHNMRIYSVNMNNYLDKWRVRWIKSMALRKVESTSPRGGDASVPIYVPRLTSNGAILNEVNRISEEDVVQKRALLSASDIASLGVTGCSAPEVRDAFDAAQEPRKESCSVM